MINMYARNFVIFARAHPEMQFDLTPVGCGLAGYDQEEIKSTCFYDLPDNVHFTKEWKV